MSGFARHAVPPGFLRHAAAPPGNWINDPNGLAFAGGRYRLFVQHRAPDGRVGWARLSSDDLRAWKWDGPVIAPAGTVSAYSGSVVADGGALTAWLTRHDTATMPSTESQWRAVSGDAGATWRFDPAAVGPHGRNVRDPFVWHSARTGDWRMLVARPCDWRDWRGAPPSTLNLWRSPDARRWSEVATIGPWDPPGVMWEVPVALEFDGGDVLIVSTLDRRTTPARTAVRAWSGRFGAAGFTPEAGPSLVDLGPDFYALCPNTVGGWPTGERVGVGWASNWATAGSMPWPGGVRGGPVAAPRALGFDPVNRRLTQRPLGPPDRSFAVAGAVWLNVPGERAALTVAVDHDGITVTRRGEDPMLEWTGREQRLTASVQELCVFVDSGLVAVFIAPAGLVATAFVPGARATDIYLIAGSGCG